MFAPTSLVKDIPNSTFRQIYECLRLKVSILIIKFLINFLWPVNEINPIGAACTYNRRKHVANGLWQKLLVRGGVMV